MTPEEILTSNKPQTPEDLIKAIKALGNTVDEIKSKLIELGFQNYNQKDPGSCPVCQYLKSIGVESPYVFVSEIDCRNGGANDRIINLENNDELQAMRKFQELAQYGCMKEFGGYDPDYSEDDESEDDD